MSKNNKTKELIFETATRLLNQNGTLVLKDISKEANVNIAAINYYFDDKEHLIREIITNKILTIKEKLINYFNYLPNDLHSRRNILKEILLDLYDYAIENMGTIKYIFSPDNQKISEQTVSIYLHQVALDTNFMDKLMYFFRSICKFNSVNQYRIKYTQLISGFCFPIVVEIDYANVKVTYFNSFKDPTFRKNYVAQLCETVFMDIPD